MVLIFAYLVAGKIEPLLRCPLTVRMSSVEKCLPSSSPVFELNSRAFRCCAGLSRSFCGFRNDTSRV